MRKRESSVAGPHDTRALQTAHEITTRLLYTFKLKPSISPAATYSPDPQTRSIKDGRPKPAVYGSPSYGARWDPEATPLRADRGSQPSASGARVKDSRQRKLRHSACLGATADRGARRLSSSVLAKGLSIPPRPRRHPARPETRFTGAGSCCPIMGRQDPGLSPWPYTLRFSGFPLPPGLTPRREVACFFRPAWPLRGTRVAVVASLHPPSTGGGEVRRSMDEYEDRGVGSCRISPHPTPPCCLTPNKAPVKLSTPPQDERLGLPKNPAWPSSGRAPLRASAGAPGAPQRQGR